MSILERFDVHCQGPVTGVRYQTSWSLATCQHRPRPVSIVTRRLKPPRYSTKVRKNGNEDPQKRCEGLRNAPREGEGSRKAPLTGQVIR
jgi:hypothetical protein